MTSDFLMGKTNVLTFILFNITLRRSLAKDLDLQYVLRKQPEGMKLCPDPEHSINAKYV